MNDIRREARRLARAALLLGHLAAGAVTTHLVFPLAAVSGLDRHGRWREVTVRAWMRALLRILNVNLRVHGTIRHGTVLYCANHVSWLDIPCLRAILDTAFVAKAEVRRWWAAWRHRPAPCFSRAASAGPPTASANT